MCNATFTKLTVNNFKEKLNKIIRERSENGSFSVSVQVPREILNNVENYYYQQAYSTRILKNNADYVMLDISWL